MTEIPKLALNKLVQLYGQSSSVQRYWFGAKVEGLWWCGIESRHLLTLASTSISPSVSLAILVHRTVFVYPSGTFCSAGGLVYESFLSMQWNWAGKKLQKTASKGFIIWSNDIIYKTFSLKHIALYCLLKPYPWSLSILLKCHGFSLMLTCKTSINKTLMSTWTCA